MTIVVTGAGIGGDRIPPTPRAAILNTPQFFES